MPTICIQCAMEAMLKAEDPPTFEESPEEHGARVHPNLEETRRRRVELERLLTEKFKGG